MKPFIPDNPYILLTPGPLSASPTVREAMLRDWCTWDDEYNALVQEVRFALAQLASSFPRYSVVLMQGSGTFSVESVIGSAIPENGRLLVLVNGAYGKRIAEIANKLRIRYFPLDFGELGPPDAAQVSAFLDEHPEISHVAMVHCETTTGMLNSIEPVAEVVKRAKKVFILDAMSSFGGIPLDMEKLNIDFLISSANKCIQGVPGFGFVIATEEQFQKCRGQARSHSLDLYDQWKTMETYSGKWRFTSPTHTVRAFQQALKELIEEGGIERRFERYRENQKLLVEGMREAGFKCLLPEELHSPIITAFLNPSEERFDFREFYRNLKAKGFVIYPGKVTQTDTFRVGNIGHVFRADIERFLQAVNESIYW